MKIKNLKTKIAVVGASSFGLIASAHAELPAAAAAAVAEVSTLLDDFIAAAWPVAATLVVAAIGIKLFKKFSNKAT